jgi:hypothetical protein
MKRVVLATIICALCTFALVTKGRAEDTQRRALAEELLGLMDIQKNIEKSYEMVKQMVPAQLKQMGVSEETLRDKAKVEMQKMMDLIMNEMSWDKLKDDYISIYAETFTEEELEGVVEFYKSPIGRKFIEKQPELLRRSMQISQKQMGKLMPKIQKLTQEMKEKVKKQEAVSPSN